MLIHVLLLWFLELYHHPLKISSHVVNPYNLNPNFNTFQKQITHPLKSKWFMLSKIPAAYIAGVKVENVTANTAIVSVRKKWLNQNPFRSMYFAVLSMAAEMSTGILCMGALYQRTPAVSMLIVKVEGTFIKKAIGKITFTCNDGSLANDAVEKAIATREGTSVVCHSTGVNEQGEVVAEFNCTWSFKARSSSGVS